MPRSAELSVIAHLKIAWLCTYRVPHDVADRPDKAEERFKDQRLRRQTALWERQGGLTLVGRKHKIPKRYLLAQTHTAQAVAKTGKLTVSGCPVKTSTPKRDKRVCTAQRCHTDTES